MKKPKCRTRDGEHSWYRWGWSRENGRYERECSIMGCEAFQYLKGTVVAADPIVMTDHGKEHVHDWSSWGPVEEFQVKDNRFYDRRCRNCEAIEETGNVKEIGEALYFSRKEARKP